MAQLSPCLPGKVKLANSIKLPIYQKLTAGNIRGWLLRPATDTKHSPAAVLYLHGISATRAYAPRVFLLFGDNLNLAESLIAKNYWGWWEAKN